MGNFISFLVVGLFLFWLLFMRKPKPHAKDHHHHSPEEIPEEPEVPDEMGLVIGQQQIISSHEIATKVVIVGVADNHYF